MIETDAQLIKKITEQVIAALQSGGVATSAPASIHPPAGTCTGDYSKFKAPDKSANTADKASPKLPAVTLKGFITARRLEDAKAKVIAIAPGAKLTPAGADYAREHKIVIQRVATSAAKKDNCGCGGDCCKQAGDKHDHHPPMGAGGVSSKWAWWIDGHCPLVNELTAQHRERLAPLAASRNPSSLAEACASMAQRVKRHQAAGGVLFVRSAALAACYANRCRSLRAIVGTCVGAVEQGVEQLAANVLIVEYPYHGRESMRLVLEAFMNRVRGSSAAVEMHLRELTSCV